MASSDYVVLAGHGSRSADANASLLTLAAAMSSQLGVPAAAGYLEMAEPSVPEALCNAAKSGASRIVLVPYFLSPGMHVRRDMTLIVDQARRELGVEIVVADFLGSHPEVLRLLVGLTRTALGREHGEPAAHGAAGDVEEVPS